jgi:hypothetical protein
VARPLTNSPLRAIVLLALAASVTLAAETWVRLSTQNFDLYTDLPADRAALLIARLETARQALGHFTVYATSNALPVRVIAFSSLDQYRAYCADLASTAYFLRSAYRDYIVIGTSSADIYTAAVHEYAHFAIHQQFHHLPRWFDEGLAEVYSTVQEKDGAIRLGLPLEERMEWLRMDGLAYDLPTLFRLQKYSDGNLRNITPNSRFYAESWILTHMLRFSPPYSSRFNDFARQLERGTPEQAAFPAVFQKSEHEVQEDLTRYLKAERIPTSLLRIDEAAPKPSLRPSLLTPQSVEAILNDLRSVLGK